MIRAFHPSTPQHYDFEALIKINPALEKVIVKNRDGKASIDFSDQKSIVLLNQSLLAHYFKVKHWDLPEGNLCPAVPGRAHYIYHLQSLLGNKKANVLDIGCGANLIYPLLGNAIFGWTFVGSDINISAIEQANHIVKQNELNKYIEIRHQKDSTSIFNGIIKKTDYFDAVVCNPPFYSTKASAERSNRRKNLNLHRKQKPRNFSGKEHEITFPGGEFQFINNMIYESSKFKNQVNWFTSLVSKSESLKNLKAILEKSEIKNYKLIEMAQGQKISRILAWQY